MSKLLKPGRRAVELSPGAPRPSRIRRDPPPRPAAKQPTLHDAAERETWTVVIGILLFSIAITVIIFGISDYLSK